MLKLILLIFICTWVHTVMYLLSDIVLVWVQCEIYLVEWNSDTLKNAVVLFDLDACQVFTSSFWDLWLKYFIIPVVESNFHIIN